MEKLHVFPEMRGSCVCVCVGVCTCGERRDWEEAFTWNTQNCSFAVMAPHRPLPCRFKNEMRSSYLVTSTDIHAWLQSRCYLWISTSLFVINSKISVVWFPSWIQLWTCWLCVMDGNVFNRTPMKNLFVLKIAPMTSISESGVSKESSGVRWTWVDFGRGWSFTFFNLIHMNDSAFFAILCIFITVSSTLGKGREGRNSSSSSILWAKEENKRMGQRTG